MAHSNRPMHRAIPGITPKQMPFTPTEAGEAQYRGTKAFAKNTRAKARQTARKNAK